MTVIRSLQDLHQQYPHPVLTIGNFDGVHLGHRALFNQVKTLAVQANGTSMVLTFEPHPMRVLREDKNPPLITLYYQKIGLIEAMGLDVTICLEFTKEFAKVEPEDFIKGILVDRIGVKEIVIGYDYTFGRKARGNRQMLIDLGRQYGFVVHTVDAQPSVEGDIISSTLIRNEVLAGRVEKAPVLLGRPYRISGRVIHGQNRGGKMLGFPTANLRLVDELVPAVGVYAVRVHLNGQIYNGVANIGFNPTFGDVGLSVEVHCFDFDRDIYDHDIKVDFIARIRDEAKFSGPDELAAQIAQDCRRSREILAAGG